MNNLYGRLKVLSSGSGNDSRKDKARGVDDLILPGGVSRDSSRIVVAGHVLGEIAEFEDGDLLARANELGERSAARSTAWKQKFAGVADVLGLGAMRVGEFRLADGRTPDAARTKAMINGCLERGVVVLTAGVDSNVLRVLMPFVMTDTELDEAMNVMEVR